MRQGLSLALLAVACSFVPAAAHGQTVDERPGVAVLPFFNGGSYGSDPADLERLQIGLQQMVIHELVQNTSLRVVDRSVLREIMAEVDLGATERMDAATAARIGRLVGARYVVVGGFVDWMGDFQIEGRIVDGETSEILRSAQTRDRRENLYRLVIEMAARVTDGIRLPPLPAPVREARASRDVPVESIIRYSMILSLRDGGQRERALELYRDLVRDFPNVPEWRAEMNQLAGL